MPSNLYDIEPIERYLLGQMEPAERVAFEALLQADEGHRAEVENYRRLFGGFAAIRSEAFRKLALLWEAEADAASDEVELIEWYLNGQLQGPGRNAFEERMLSDEHLAGEVEAYRQLHYGFSAARSEVFRDKLEGWESAKSSPVALKAASRRPLLYRIAAAAAAVLLLAGFGLNWYANSHYSRPALVASYYQPPRSETIMGNDQPTLTTIAQQFTRANELFQKQHYAEAYQAFDGLLGSLPAAGLDKFNHQYFLEQSEWNRLLAAMAMDTPPLDPAGEARRIAGADGHEFQAEAKRLSRQLQSVWYKWAN
ncbi:MAG: hypothetical protein KDC66_23420 [Phaeodactylibacter sp.]|nr:hypothetical protein [Phaeodactylibacter sp.]MCB9273663.1 hypothetical protein [Lewinellaceae bacterium]